MIGIILRLCSCLLAATFLLYWTDGVEGINIASQYFITINVPSNVKSSYLGDIKKIMCDTKKKNAKCYLNLKVVGEPKVILAMKVDKSDELERRLATLSRKASYKYESEPIVNYVNFARNVLGVSSEIAVPKENTLKQTPEVVWCEFNINFGDNNSTELLDIWKREAEAYFAARNLGVKSEIFKTLGERTVHFLTDLPADNFDQVLFLDPFAEEIPNSVTTTCKVAIKF